MPFELPLPSLSVAGFRGIRALDLPRLGHVTLLAGRNGVGKTTVLEAVQAYVSRGDPMVLVEALDDREEVVPLLEEGRRVMSADFASLFHQQQAVRARQATIRSKPADNDITLEVIPPGDERAQHHLELLRDDAPDVPLLAISIGASTRVFSAVRADVDVDGRHAGGPGYLSSRRGNTGWPEAVHHQAIGPNPLDNASIGALWDNVALGEGEDLATSALRVVVGDELERVTVLGGGASSSEFVGRRAVVKLRGVGETLPLKRLGAGAVRLFGVALAIANCRSGVLVIDEAENGIHHSVQRDFWSLVFDAALSADVQVIGTTHSWDCVVGFARAALATEGEGVLFRLEGCPEGVVAVEYSERNLKVAADQRIEVR